MLCLSIEPTILAIADANEARLRLRTGQAPLPEAPGSTRKITSLVSWYAFRMAFERQTWEQGSEGDFLGTGKMDDFVTV